MNKVMFRILTAAVIAALVLTVGFAQAQSSDKQVRTSSTGLWIVQLEDAPTSRFEGAVIESVTDNGSSASKALEATSPMVTGAVKLSTESQAVQRYMAHLDDMRNQVLQQAEFEMGRAMQPRHIYRHVLNGFAIELSETEAQRLAQQPGVQSVEPDFVEYLQTDAGPAWIGAERFWAGTGGVPNANFGEGAVLGVIDTGINWESVFIDAQAAGVSPVNNPRPAELGLCSDAEVLCSGKLIGVYDFTDEGTNGKDPDGHGSHVATTAAGFPLNFSLSLSGGIPIPFETSGVAPRASIISYKACVENPDGGNFICRFSDTSAALEQAIDNAVDVVNYSIGGSPSSPWTGTQAQRFLNMRTAGIVPVIAAGNDGPGLGSLSSPANYPWVFAAANGSHDRILGNQLTSTSGGSSSIGTLTGLGSTAGTSVLPIVHASDFGNALCGVGEAELGSTCGANTGATNPFEPGTFNGQIVVCDRGIYGRIEKGRNVQAAGAAGMILANTDAEGEDINDDEHCLPATHIGAEEGDRLRDWLDSGSNHAGRLTGTTRVVDGRFGGFINQGSGRGPAVGAENVMKPNAVAPGTNVLAASFDGPNSLSFLTGTSMASPHVAGAALLLRRSHPTWGVDEVFSALETTADPTIVQQADGSEARIIDRGAGGIQVDRAARIGLYLPTTAAQFQAANPASGGDPSSLNLPGMVSTNCIGECTFTRRLRALGNGTWTVSTEGDLDIQVTPSSFTLSNGQEQVVDVRVRPGSAAIGDWAAGAVVLESSNSQFVNQRLPVGVFVSGGIVPERLNFTSETNRGRGTFLIEDALPLPEAIYRTSALVRPERRSPTLSTDPSNDDPYDGGAGVSQQIVSVPANALALYVETFASSSNDIDLFVGQDLNGNNQADEFEEVCSSTTPDDLENCLIEQPEAGNWWIVVQNWSGSVSGSDTVPFEFAVLADETDDSSLVVSGIANHPGGDLELPVYWDQPAMLRNERWLGAIAIASSPDFSANLGTVLTTVTRTDTNTPQITPLFEGRTETVVVPANSEHDAIFIDVPPGATSFNATITGSLDNVSITRYPFNLVSELAVPLSELIIPPIGVPPGDPVLSIQQTGNTWEVELTPFSDDGELPSERYYLVLENDAASEVLVTVNVEVTESSRIEPQRGLWSPRDRLIFHGFQYDLGGGNAFMIWYTFDEEGINTFYLSDAKPVDQTSSYFSQPLFRFTSDGTRQTADTVGEVQITSLSESLVSFAWSLNGTRNAELYDVSNGSDCPSFGGDTQQLLGLWAPDGVREGGASALLTSQAEVWIRYYFDNTGQPRWVYADAGSVATSAGSRTMNVDEFRGFCIYCDESELSFQTVGTMQREFNGLTGGREIINFTSLPPLNQTYSTDRPLRRITSTFSCSN